MKKCEICQSDLGMPSYAVILIDASGVVVKKESYTMCQECYMSLKGTVGIMKLKLSEEPL